jgi:hypothetical protein
VTNTEAAAASLVMAVSFTALAAVIPAPLVLPVLSAFAVTTALAVAAYACLRSVKQTGARLTAWDVAGGLIFIGFAAAMLSNPESITPLLEQNFERQAAIR